jgi:hypothetical protein
LDDSVLELLFEIDQNEVVSDVQLHVRENELLLLQLADYREAQHILLGSTVPANLFQHLFTLFVLLLRQSFLRQRHIMPQGRYSIKVFLLLRAVKYVFGDVEVRLLHVQLLGSQGVALTVVGILIQRNNVVVFQKDNQLTALSLWTQAQVDIGEKVEQLIDERL